MVLGPLDLSCRRNVKEFGLEKLLRSISRLLWAILLGAGDKSNVTSVGLAHGIPAGNRIFYVG